jgi:hypothetical protein
MLVTALFLVASLLIAVAAHALITRVREKSAEAARLAITAEATEGAGTTYRLEDPLSGPFAFCSSECPWGEARVDARSACVIPLRSFTSVGEEPYITASPALQAMPEAVMALRELCGAMVGSDTVTPCVTAAYTSYAAAGDAAGTLDLHTGYALTLCLRLEQNGVVQDLSLSDALSHPLTASTALWLISNRARYGFVQSGEDAGHWLYVGAPHAAYMAQEGLSPEDYLALLRTHLQSSPLVYTDSVHAWRIFYVVADHSAATVTLPSALPYHAVGDGVGGFLVTLLDG